MAHNHRGVKMSPSDPPHAVIRIRHSLPDASAPVRHPWGTVRPPASPNRSEGAVSRPAVGSGACARFPPRLGSLPRLTSPTQVVVPPS
jgi:hypothetical protein